MAMTSIPKELEPIRRKALRAIQPIKPADDSTKADDDLLFKAKRTNAGKNLPQYFLVYFLLVDLLGFRNSGKWEKLAWSVPIDFKGRAFLIEHRKFGLGVFAHDPASEENAAQQIVMLIQKGVKAAQPFFEFLAKQAVQKSKFNVENLSNSLYERFEYFFKMYQTIANEAKQHTGKYHIEKENNANGFSTTIHIPEIKLRKNAEWIALATIDAFFSWTEHVFIHIAILSGKVVSGMSVADLAEADWQSKFKHAIDVNEQGIKPLYDNLILIRQQLRNCMAHGAFGKQGAAFSFHSGAGVAPVLLPHKRGKSRFALSGDLGFDENAAIGVIREFIALLWSGSREPAKLYIQESGLPLILPLASDGTYYRAMRSASDMEELVERLNHQFDQAANMDW